MIYNIYNLNKQGSHIVESLDAIYIGDHNYPEIEYQINLWNYTENKCEHFAVICNDKLGTYTIPANVFELARQPKLIRRMGRELI